MKPLRLPLPREGRALAGLALVLSLCASLLAGPVKAQAPTPEELQYEVLYDVRVLPTERAAHVRIHLGKNAARVQRLRFRIDPARHLEFKGKGEVKAEGEYVEWYPPKEGGKLEYLFRIDHLRDDRYDARSAENWALFRGDDLIPPTHASTDDGARAQAKLRLRLPKGWKAAVPFEEADDGTYLVVQEHRGFDRPTGWMLVGKLSVSRVKMRGMHVVIASPKKSPLRRQDLLALFRWTLPTVEEIAGSLPPRLLVVGAGDPMWRGGLSGPHSLYLHADRPLIEDDMTSPVLHELIHTLMGARAGDDSDWIIEGLAELYSLEVLQRSRTISKAGYERALRKLESKGAKITALRVPRADSKVTARAVIVLKKLDEEIRTRTEGQRSLDDVFRLTLKRREKLSTEDFRQIAEAVAGADLGDFFERYVPVRPTVDRAQVKRD